MRYQFLNKHCHKLNITNIPHQMIAFFDSSLFLLLRYIRFLLLLLFKQARPTSSGRWREKPLAIFAWTQVLESCCSPEMSVFSTFSPWDRASHRKNWDGASDIIWSPHFLDVVLNFKSMASRHQKIPMFGSRWCCRCPSQGPSKMCWWLNHQEVVQGKTTGRKKRFLPLNIWGSCLFPWNMYVYIYKHNSL